MECKIHPAPAVLAWFAPNYRFVPPVWTQLKALLQPIGKILPPG